MSAAHRVPAVGAREKRHGRFGGVAPVSKAHSPQGGAVSRVPNPVFQTTGVKPGGTRRSSASSARSKEIRRFVLTRPPMGIDSRVVHSELHCDGKKKGRRQVQY